MSAVLHGLEDCVTDVRTRAGEKEVQELRGKLTKKEEESDLDGKNAQHGEGVKHPCEATVHQSEASFSQVVKSKNSGRASTPTMGKDSLS